jgi:hypothetical protein
MELSDTKIEIMDLISRFESLWTGVTHPNKYKDRVCTLLFLNLKLFNIAKFQNQSTFMIHVQKDLYDYIKEHSTIGPKEEPVLLYACTMSNIHTIQIILG